MSAKVGFHHPNTGSFKAGEDLTAAQYTAVKNGTVDGEVIQCDGLGERHLGILQNAPALGEAAEVALPGGGGYMKVDASIAANAELRTGTDGIGEAAATTNRVVAISQKSDAATAANDVIPVLVTFPYQLN